MRRAAIIVVLAALLGGGGLLVASRPELLDLVGLGGDTARLRRLALSFLEDIQFKDFASAAGYHSPDEQDTVDIPFLLERLFMVKPEQLDIMQYEILFAKVDSTGLRGRVKSLIKVKNLLKEEIHDRELMLYFHRDALDKPWYMKLESSLRHIQGDKEKIH